MQTSCKMKENVNIVLTSIRHPILKDSNQTAEKLNWDIRWDCYCQDTIMQRNCLRSCFCAFWRMSHPANSVYRLTRVDNVAVYWLQGFLGTKALRIRAVLCWNPVPLKCKTWQCLGQAQLQSIYHCQCGIKPGAVWTGEVQASEDAHQLRGVRVAFWLHLQALMQSRGPFHPMSVDKLCVCSFLSVHTHHPQEVIVLIWVTSYRDKLWLLYWKEGAVYAGMAMGEFSLSSTRSASQQELVAAW